MPFVFTEWYEKHGAELNERRTKRYREDPEYRASIQRRNADARAKRRQAAQQEEQAADEARLATPEPRWKEFVVTNPANPAEKVAAFSIGALAAATHRSIQTLRQWEEEGVIDPPDATSGKGDRLYTVARIERIVTKLEEEGRLTETGRQHRSIPSVRRTVVFQDQRTAEFEFYQIATLVRATGRTLVTLQQMEGRGVLPATPFRASARQYRVYTAEQIAVVKAAFLKYPALRGKTVQDEFRKFILAGWERDMPGIMQARLSPDPHHETRSEDSHEA